MRRFAETCEAVAATTKKNEKVRLVSAYLSSLPLTDAARAAVFFTGQAFPRCEEKVLAVGGSLIWQAVGRLAELDRKSTRLNSSHGYISYAVFCLKKKKKIRYVPPLLQI